MQNHGLGTHNEKQLLLSAHPKVPQILHKLFGPIGQNILDILKKALLPHPKSVGTIIILKAIYVKFM